MKIKKYDIFEIQGQILYQGISFFCKRSDMQYPWKNLVIILTQKYLFSSKEYALYKMKLFNSKHNPTSQTFHQCHVTRCPLEDSQRRRSSQKLSKLPKRRKKHFPGQNVQTTNLKEDP